MTEQLQQEAPLAPDRDFGARFTLVDAKFTRRLFGAEFMYNGSGFVDFTNVRPEVPGKVPSNPGLYAAWPMPSGLAGVGLLARRRCAVGF